MTKIFLENKFIRCTFGPYYNPSHLVNLEEQGKDVIPQRNEDEQIKRQT